MDGCANAHQKNERATIEGTEPRSISWGLHDRFMSYLLFTLAAALQTVRPTFDSMELVCFL